MPEKTTTQLITLCDHALTSQQGKLSIIGIFDRIFVSQLPSKYPRFFIVAILKGKPGAKIEVSMRVTSPSEKALLPEKSVEVHLGGNGKANIITDVANLTFQELGEYTIELVSESTSLGKANFHVNRAVSQDKIDQKN